MRKFKLNGKKIAALLMLPLSFAVTNSQAAIEGIAGTLSAGVRTFNLEVKQVSIQTPDGDSFKIWGYGEVGGTVQYPGPTLIAQQGETVNVTLVNNLPTTGGVPTLPVSAIFPGQEGVAATGGTVGLLTNESNGSLDTVTYSFPASNPGTYMYQSGTRPGLQVEMGLIGALIIRPTGFAAGVGGNRIAYNGPGTDYDHEYLFILTEMDPMVHYLVEFGYLELINNAVSHPVLWFINGRNGPDTVFGNHYPFTPYQPYSSLAEMLPGERSLVRVIGAGRDLHPFHLHGNNFSQIARDGRLLQSAESVTLDQGPDLAESDYTLKTAPGATYDAIFEWDGANLGWDIYGHAPGDAMVPTEDPADHGKPIPVALPEQSNLTFGGFYSGSPFLGAENSLPPGEGGLNLTGGMFFIWHSHTEKELVNNDVFPGGMMTFIVVQPPGTPIVYSNF